MVSEVSIGFLHRGAEMSADRKMSPVVAWLCSKLLIYIPGKVLPAKDYLVEKNKKRVGARSLFWSAVLKGAGIEWHGDASNRRVVEELLFHLESYYVEGVPGVAFYPRYYDTHKALCISFFKVLQEQRLSRMNLDSVWVQGSCRGIKKIAALHIIFPKFGREGGAYRQYEAYASARTVSSDNTEA